ncbi:hypothetical protein P3T76_015756 [Phytophthora citrophthora]|uniref:Uncharacterized protein n=1 Tax=Phytophthora citrophthora TaxID=4793 RepID=A0AAD9FYW4_9STRA|nr:hypothetical protein P3T76_015756 [Phytophthora citrophthora]
MQARQGDEVGHFQPNNRSKGDSESAGSHVNREFPESTLKVEQVKRSRNVETWNAKCIKEEENFEQHGKFFKRQVAVFIDINLDIGIGQRLASNTSFQRRYSPPTTLVFRIHCVRLSALTY